MLIDVMPGLGPVLAHLPRTPAVVGLVLSGAGAALGASAVALAQGTGALSRWRRRTKPPTIEPPP